MRASMGATPVATPPPVPGGARPPIWPLIVGNNGGFMAVRSSPAQGACGVGSYPCKHPGVDVNGARGTRVYAPESGAFIMAGDGTGAPLGGYGPWAAILRGDSGVFHMLAHMDPSQRAMSAPGRIVRAGDQVGIVSSANHVHWEVRRKAVPNFSSGESNATNNMDPIAWLSQQGGGGAAALILLGAAAVTFYLVWS